MTAHTPLPISTDLAAAFDAMSQSVENARAALQNETTAHQKTAAALAETSERLSDALARLERAQQQIIQRERLQALQQISYGVVHDFNSALTPILGMSECLLADRTLMESNKDLEESIAVINEAALRSRDVIRNLANFFSPSSQPETAPFDLNAIAIRAVEVTRPIWKEVMRSRGQPVNLNVRLSTLPLLLNGNASDVEAAIVNILLNAVEALPEGGDITIHSVQEGTDAVLDVTDSGEGMSLDTQSRCFEPFFSTKPTSASGMGLTATRMIVTQLRGEISLTSERGKGTTVRLRFPTIPIQTPQSHIPHKPVVTSVRVLLIDDETGVSLTIQKYLHGPNITVTSCFNGREGIDEFKAGDYDVVVLDRSLPDISGDMVAVQLKALSPTTPIVMLTGFAGLMKNGGKIPDCVDHLLGKPCTRQDLKNAIDAVLTKYA